LAHTSDGLAFTDDGAITIPGDGDSDAYHYVGYAHSADALNWTVDYGMTNPLVRVDYANMGTTDVERHHYTGRVYYRALMVTTIQHRTGAPRPCPLGLACGSGHVRPVG
jgi:hypothetical protein